MSKGSDLYVSPSHSPHEWLLKPETGNANSFIMTH